MIMKTLMKKLGLLMLSASLIFVSCKKEIQEQVADQNSEFGRNDQGHLQQTKTFSSAVVVSWINMQLDMLRTPLPAGAGSQVADRAMAYTGLTLYEAVVGGMPAYQSLYGQLNDFPMMPQTEPGKAYHWGASANAALAEINRRLFPTTAAANMTALNNLENTLKAQYATQVDAAVLNRSIAYGREVATRIGNWAATDGNAIVNSPYVPPVGPGLWIPTSPGAIVSPYASQRRLLVPGVTNNTALAPPPPYSTVVGSDFYNMVKDVYDKSLALTPAQLASAVYFRDNPGYPGGGGFISILSQIFDTEKPMLDQAALAYAKVGLAQHEATVILFVQKYIYNTVRPITYIRTVMNQPNWNTAIPTPNHPEFPSGHATINGAVTEMMSMIWGSNYSMTLHTYDYQNLPPRHYNNFAEMSRDMADSRVYGGLHYQATADKSLVQGKQIAHNILSSIEFLKP